MEGKYWSQFMLTGKVEHYLLYRQEEACSHHVCTDCGAAERDGCLYEGERGRQEKSYL